MVDITKAQPHVLRIGIVVICLLTVFLFFDPIGFASSAMADHLPGTTSAVTHIVLYQFKSDIDRGAVDVVCFFMSQEQRGTAELTGLAQACAKMMSLRDTCLSPNSNHAYIKSITGGKDNSNEALQVSFPPANATFI